MGVEHHKMATETETQTFLETYVIGHYLSILHHARTNVTLQHLFTTDQTPKQRKGFNQAKGKPKSV